MIITLNHLQIHTNSGYVGKSYDKNRYTKANGSEEMEMKIYIKILNLLKKCLLKTVICISYAWTKDIYVMLVYNQVTVRHSFCTEYLIVTITELHNVNNY